MSNPFDVSGIGGFGGLGGMLGGLQEQMAAFQAQAELEEVEATAGGLVTVRMNGAQDVLSVSIDPKATTDRELLEDLVRAATNDAIRKSKEAAAAKLAGFAQAMGLPPGLF